MKSFKELLMVYSSLQEEPIKLVYRPVDARWNKGVFYGDKDYDEYTDYNHRSILTNEIVFEWDTEDPELNRKYVDEVARRLKTDHLCIAKWKSGNKSLHLHTLVDTKEATNLSLLKRTFIKYYCEGLPLPDMQLCGHHMIRAEGGLHEKTGKRKSLVSASGGYPKVGVINQGIWDEYNLKQEAFLKTKLVKSTQNFREHPTIQYLLNTDNLKNAKDGRKTGLFLLVHALKDQYSKEELQAFLASWYKYAGGSGLSDSQVKHIVSYNYNRTYSLKTLLDNFKEDYIKV